MLRATHRQGLLSLLLLAVKGATNGRPPHLAKRGRDTGHPLWWQTETDPRNAQGEGPPSAPSPPPP
jgi:hypothetical protein